MVTARQVKLLRQKLMEGKTMAAASAAAGMSERSGRKWKAGSPPSESRAERTWRTRQDPFEGVWETELVPLLERDKKGKLQATTLLEILARKHPERFGDGHLRTLQRRLRDWRALHGPEKEVYFEQEKVPGKEGALDFTNCDELEVTIGGVAFPHLLFEFVLLFSSWTWARVAFSETFEALVEGFQGALWGLGARPEWLRTDNLSAATHKLKGGGRELNRRFKAVLEHYEMQSRRINRGKSHENGAVEQRHNRTKRLLEEELVLRGSRDFDSLENYEAFVQEAVERRHNQRSSVAGRLAEEQPLLAGLPLAPVPDYSVFKVKVRRWSTLRLQNNTYSVPSRLIGREVKLRVYARVVEVWYRDRLVQRMPRLRGEGRSRIDYRHVIHSLVRKPGAFAGYRFREELFPTLVFRRAFDALRRARGDRADVEYVRILHLAATTMEVQVEEALGALLDAGVAFDYAAVQQQVRPVELVVPEVDVPPPDLQQYNQLLEGRAA